MRNNKKTSTHVDFCGKPQGIRYFKFLFTALLGLGIALIAIRSQGESVSTKPLPPLHEPPTQSSAPQKPLPLEVRRVHKRLYSSHVENKNATAEVPAPAPKLTLDTVETKKPVQIIRRTNGAVLYAGSLRNNIERIAHQYGWDRVVWTLPEDYRWVGETTIKGGDLPSILRQLLADYPLQADFFEGNHVLVITPRTLQ